MEKCATTQQAQQHTHTHTHATRVRACTTRHKCHARNAPTTCKSCQQTKTEEKCYWSLVQRLPILAGEAWKLSRPLRYSTETTSRRSISASPPSSYCSVRRTTESASVNSHVDNTTHGANRTHTHISHALAICV